MGCFQSPQLGKDIDLNKNNSENILNFRPVHLIQIPGEPDQKLEPTPSFGSRHKNFGFDSARDRDHLEID